MPTPAIISRLSLGVVILKCVIVVECVCSIRSWVYSQTYTCFNEVGSILSAILVFFRVFLDVWYVMYFQPQFSHSWCCLTYKRSVSLIPFFHSKSFFVPVIMHTFSYSSWILDTHVNSWKILMLLAFAYLNIFVVIYK